MSLHDLNAAKLILILKTSQGFAAQLESSKAMIKIVNGTKLLSPSRTGHAISSHVRGAALTGVKTKFCSIDDMAGALNLVLKTTAGQQALSRLGPGGRESLEVEINQLFPIEGVVDGIGPVTFSTRDMSAAHLTRIKCRAVLEGRSRGSELYLHVHTFFPALNQQQLTQLFDAKTAP